MSVEKLDLREGSQWLRARHIQQGCFTIAVQDGLEVKEIGLDRSQAHSLMLYLQEHLKKLKLAKLSFWYCSRCNKYHDANYVCVML